MRKFVLVVAVAVFALMVRADEWTHSYPVTGKPELVVDASDADVEIAVGSSQQVEARVITRGLKINDDLKITANQSRNRVELRLHRRERICIGFCNKSVRVEVHVPRESDLNVHTGDGNIRVESVRGNMQLQTSDGDARIRDVEGSLHAETHDGNVNVSGRLDLLNVHTEDGDIDAEVTAISTPQLGWILHTGDGNVRLRLPSDFAADLDAHTGDGNLKIDFPVTTSGSNKGNSLRGKMNGGGVSLEVRTGDGDIRIEKM